MLDTSFLGRGWSFPVSFSGKGGAKMSEYEDDIAESLRIILMTYPGERTMQPEFGSRLRDFCFVCGSSAQPAVLFCLQRCPTSGVNTA